MIRFKRNMGPIDRLIRLAIGTVLLVVGPAANLVELAPVEEVVLGVLGVFAILSAILSYCMLYELTGSNTLKKTHK